MDLWKIMDMCVNSVGASDPEELPAFCRSVCVPTDPLLAYEPQRV